MPPSCLCVQALTAFHRVRLLDARLLDGLLHVAAQRLGRPVSAALFKSQARLL